MKTCRKCGVTKPVDDFYKHRLMRDGRASECKVCHRAAALAWREAHPGYTAERWQANKSAMSAAHRDYVARKLAEDPNWRRNRINRAYAASSHMQKAAVERARAWSSANPEKRTQIATRYNRKRRTWLDPFESISTSERDEIMQTFGQRCAYCLCADLGLTLDHVDPVSRGGAHVYDNLVPACASCNSRKHAKGILSMVNRPWQL